MKVKSTILFVILDDGSIRQVILDEKQKDAIKHTLYFICDTVKCSTVDFSDVMILPENNKT